MSFACGDRDLALVGGGAYGTIYAVAELYDRLGARWYLPGELGACVPKLKTVRFDALDVRRTPSFAMRWIGTDAQWNLRNRSNRIDDENYRRPMSFIRASTIPRTVCCPILSTANPIRSSLP